MNKYNLLIILLLIALFDLAHSDEQNPEIIGGKDAVLQNLLK